MSKHLCVIYGPVDTYSGYGSRCRDLVKSIIETKGEEWDIVIQSCRWGNTPWGFLTDHEEWSYLNEYVLTQPLNKQPEVFIWVTVPNEFQKIGKYNIGITAGMETTLVDPSWIEGCNRMDLVLVSSEHSKKVFQDSRYGQKNEHGQMVGELGLTTPMEVLLEGANLDIYKKLPKVTAFPELNNIPESFAYLFVGHWLQGDFGQDRKNVGLLIKIFFELFKNKQTAPALVLKTSMAGSSYLGRDALLKKVEEIKNSVNARTYPNIYIIHGEFSDAEMNELYNHDKIKAMVSLTKGEGFGRPLLEFSLTQKPILATNWSGHIDFLKPEFTSLIGGQLTQVHPSAVVPNMILPEAGWFSPHQTEISFYLNDIWNNYKKYKILGKRQAFYSKTNFSYEKMSELLVGYWTKYVPDFPKQMELKMPKLKKIGLKKKPKLEKTDG